MIGLFIAVLPPVGSPTKDLRNSRHVLLIEDNRDAARALDLALRLLGHEVSLASTGTEGLAKARELLPDIIVCDIGLPGLDGYQVARAVRDDVSLTETALVALTGYVAAENVRLATDAGFDLHLQKPLSIEDLQWVLAQFPSRAP
jgi:two-component system CheB/CheR fusion protein